MIHLERYFQINQIPDITYIGIGSACIRDSKPENMQQFPPWLETEFRNLNKTFCLINIDPKFESPYLLTQLLPIEEDINSSSSDGLFKVFKTERLTCIYINEALDFYDWIDNKYIINEEKTKPLDTINKLVMGNSKLLISGIYTGMSNDILEQYFNSLYSEKYTFNTLITYNFMDDKEGSCMVDLTKNFPLIDYKINQIIKLDIILNDLDLETIKCIYGENINGLEQKIINWSINKLKKLPNMEMYLYRNYINNNYQPFMEWTKNMSSFKNMDLSKDDTDINQMLETINLTYLPYASLLKSSGIDISDLYKLIQSIPTTFLDIYTWSSDYTRTINLIIEKHLK